MLSNTLKQLRHERGYTLRRVEALSGVSNGYLSQLESGKITNPSFGRLVALADAYGVPIVQLTEAAGYKVDCSEELARTENETRSLYVALRNLVANLEASELSRQEQLVSHSHYMKQANQALDKLRSHFGYGQEGEANNAE